MVSVNVAQLLQEPLGAVREFEFSDRLTTAGRDLPLRGAVLGRARLIRTNDGILVHAEYLAPVALECARCLNEARSQVRGESNEQFLPSVEVRTGVPVAIPGEDDQPRIDEHHEIDLDEVLRQNILTNLPLQPLCEPTCPGLCAQCGERLDRTHTTHADTTEEDTPVDPASPFAQLAVLLNDEAQER